MVSTEILRGFDLFSGLRDVQLGEIARLCHERSYNNGEIVFTVGGWATDVYLLEKGNVAIQIEFLIYDHHVRATIYTVGKGETFGWSALVPPHKLSASARCQERSDVITLNGKDLMAVLEKDSHIGYMVMKNLSALISSRFAATSVALRHELQKILKTKE